MSLRDRDNPMRWFLLGTLCAGAALAGCGGSSTATTARSPKTAASSEPLPSTAIDVNVPGLLPGGVLAMRYTCDGQDTPASVRWKGIPAGTAELVLFVVSFQPVQGKLFFDWAVAGLSPNLHGLAAGRLPSGAVVGRNGFGRDGYSICPPRGRRESYAVKVVALPRKIAVQPGVNALTLYQEAERSTKVVGFTGVTYTRPR
jgi:phosphatidylethanolamine-binding protein (PEBP) family uncharacterized protein